MQTITAADVMAVLGHVEDLVLHELIRTEATMLELRRAVQLAGRAKADEAAAALAPRMRRLVDLCAVVTSVREDPAPDTGLSHCAA